MDNGLCYHALVSGILEIAMKGFDYRDDLAKDLPTKEWRALAKLVLAAGGRRKHEAGETYYFGPDAKLVFEAYGNVPA